ncbi:MAG: hypothetical protein J7L45_01190 [Candidatus Aenigmarchaeota archaeon]|nr:hypothetical protein [Candidatus Aenigmarchaeota archaeon]
MNLKQYLLEHGVKSKETAEYLIRKGLVLLNNYPIRNPEIPVGRDDKIKILTTDISVPRTFWTMKEIQDKLSIIQTGDFVLDVEPKDGGLAIFSKRMGAEVTVLSINNMEFLKKEDIEVKKYNVIEIDPKTIFKTKFDLIIEELELDIIKSFQILEKFLDVISKNGKLLIFLSTRGREEEDVREMSERILVKYRIEPIEYFKADKGLYLFAKKF